MPYTINGIGTHYYGRRNASVVQANCQFCNRFVNLTSYDTFEAFCILFIPLIPLRRFRIVNECSSCHKHYRVPLKQFRADVEQQISPLRAAAERAPRNADARLALIHSLIEFQLNPEAEKEAIEATALMPDSAPLNHIAGYLLASRGERNGAQPFFEQAVRLDGADAEARLSAGRNLWQLQRLDEAIPYLEEASRSADQAPAALYILSDIHYRQKRWPDAYNALERLFSRSPETRGDKSVLRMMRECKQQLGYPLTDEERKSGRRWWPFGKTNAVPTKPGTESRRAVAIVVAVAILGIAGAIAFGWWKSRHIEVYFDNATGKPVAINVGSESFPLPGGPPVGRTFAPGSYTVVVTTPKGEKIESEKLTLPEVSITNALFSAPTYVYNVAAARIYRRQEIGYAKNESDATYSEEIVGAKKVIQLKGVDFLFTTPPQTMSIDASRKVETKTAFQTADDLSLVDYAYIRLGEGKFPEAEKSLRYAVALEPCWIEARQALAQTLFQNDKPDASITELRKWMADCDDAVEAHRVYQEVMRARGWTAAVQAEYRVRLEREPQSAVAHYLVGRLSDLEAAEAEYRQAAALDPNFSWPHAALGHAHLMREEYAPALAEFTKAIELKHSDASLAMALTYAAIGAGEPQKTLSVLNARNALDRFLLEESRRLTALAAGDWASARKLHDRRLRDSGGAPSIAMEEAKILQLSGDDAGMTAWIRRMERIKEVAVELEIIKLENAVAAGDQKAVEEILAGISDSIETNNLMVYQLYAAACATDPADRARLLNEVAAELGSDADLDDQSRETIALLAEALRGPKTADAVLKDARNLDNALMLKHVYFMLAARAAAAGDTRSAKSLYERSAKTAVDMEFPRAAAARIAARL